jgi:phage/plasmid primase-like uncharacterized protein
MLDTNTTHSVIEQFRFDAAQRGIILPDNVKADGALHRCNTDRRNGKGDAAYVLHLDGIPAGGFINHQDGDGFQSWCSRKADAMSPAELAAYKKRCKDESRKRDSEIREKREATAKRAQATWSKATPCADDHPYLERKGVLSYGLREHQERAVIPLYDETGDIVNLQTISADPEGEKRFMSWGRKKGCFYTIGNLTQDTRFICIGEGYATMASIHQATDFPAVVAFDCNNLDPVARHIHKSFPNARLVFCADDDTWTDKNPGIRHAQAAAKKVDGFVVWPDFGGDRQKGQTDFNDLHKAKDLYTVSLQVQKPIIRRRTSYTAASLQHIPFPPEKYVVPGYVPEGLTLLAAKPKIGKSWMMLDWGLAVAYGGTAFGGIECEAGDVLYLALEDTPKRLQKRLKQLLPDDRAWPERLQLETSWPAVEQGGLDKIRAWLDKANNPRFIGIDTLQKVRAGIGQKGMYEADYAAATPLQTLAGEYEVGIGIVHHLSKRDAATTDDPFDLVSGSTGLTGAADTILVLTRNTQGTTFYGRGRDLEEFEKAMSFDKTTGRWSVLGIADEVRRSDTEKTIMETLKQSSGEGYTPKEIADLTDLKRDTVRQTLRRMVDKNRIQKNGDRYVSL